MTVTRSSPLFSLTRARAAEGKHSNPTADGDAGDVAAYQVAASHADGTFLELRDWFASFMSNVQTLDIL